MVVRLRLALFGRKKRPFYRIRAANARTPRNGKYLEELGTYNPIPSGVDNMKEVRLNVERIKYWLAVGAQPSERVERLLAQAQIIPEPVPKKSVQSAVPKSQREKKKKVRPRASLASRNNLSFPFLVYIYLLPTYLPTWATISSHHRHYNLLSRSSSTPYVSRLSRITRPQCFRDLENFPLFFDASKGPTWSLRVIRRDRLHLSALSRSRFFGGE